ncbi:MAG: FtsX-like permease family protein, partial [Bacteroidetes bacterium]|nr:FtsX-like permease family protein [Bacteroidota bacterium]
LVAQKTKEIGVRKVLGATVADILGLFSKEFAVLVGIAFVLAAPVAYLAMNAWLENFAYKISLGVGVFAIALAASVSIVIVTVGYKAFRAATANPVDALQYE